MNETKLIKRVLEWWKEHKHDVDSDEDDEYNRYDDEPDFVTIAKELQEVAKECIEELKKDREFALANPDIGDHGETIENENVKICEAQIDWINRFFNLEEEKKNGINI